MDFSNAQYDAVIRKIESTLDTIVSDANAQIARIEHDTGWIPGIGALVKAGVDQFVQLLKEFLAKIGETLKWVEIPVLMWQFGQTWLDAASQAGQTAVNISGLDKYSSEWQGIAGGKYAAGVAGQKPAADTIQARANAISGACTWTAITGFAFYAGLLDIAVSLAFAIAGATTVVGAVPGIISALLGLADAVGFLLLGVDGQARGLRQANEPSDSFPGNAWPQAVAS
jgi:hypothetical protein